MKIKRNVFVYRDVDYPDEHANAYAVLPYESSLDCYVLVNEQEIQIEVPDNFDVTAKQVERIEAAIEEVRKDYNEKLATLQAKKQELLALPVAEVS